MVHEVIQELTVENGDWYGLRRLCFYTIQASGHFSPQPNVKISPGDTCFVLHMAPPDYANPKKPLKTALHKELRHMEKTIVKKSENIQQVHVLMLTNARLARVMELIGFNTFEVDLPEAYKERVMEGHRTSTSVIRDYELEDPRFLMCYLSGKDFVKRFKKKPKGIY